VTSSVTVIEAMKLRYG